MWLGNFSRRVATRLIGPLRLVQGIGQQRPIHSPCRISRSPQLGGDQVRHDRWRAGDMEAPNTVLDGPVTNGDALVLAQVLDPGLDDERFDVAPLLYWIVVDGPADGAVPAANRL